MGIVINSCVTGMHGMCLYSYLLCMHTLSTAYRFFVTLELAIRRKLPHHLLATATTTLTSSPPHEADVSAIVKSICDDDDVLFYWTFVGIDGGIDMDEDEDINQELL